MTTDYVRSLTADSETIVNSLRRDPLLCQEASHDLWLLRDLRNCGVNVELIKGSSPRRGRSRLTWRSV